jgi:hypothetical protein
MPHCLVQAGSLAPSADQLKRAFKSLKALTDADAVKLANDACGILLKNLSLDDAGRLQLALKNEGIAAEIVDAGQLPKLPDAKFIRRMEFQPESLTIYDPLGRAVPVPWQHLSLVSAGSVRHFGMTATRTEKKVTSFDPIRGMHTKVVTDVRHKVEDDSALLLDLFLTGGAMRFQIEAGAFQFKYCFDRPELNLVQKAGLLVQMLARSAPQAGLNRGATALRDGAPDGAIYASKAALFDESTWLVWRMARQT